MVPSRPVLARARPAPSRPRPAAVGASCGSTVVAVALFALSPVVGWHVHTNLTARAHDEAMATVDRLLLQRARELEGVVAGGGAALAVLRDLLAAQSPLTDEEFWRLAERLRQQHAGMLTIAVAPGAGAAVGRATRTRCEGTTPVEPGHRPHLAGRHPPLDAPCAMAPVTRLREVVVAEARMVPHERLGRPLAELWLAGGDDDGASPRQDRWVQLFALVDLAEAAAVAGRGDATFAVEPARMPRPPTVRAHAVLGGLWSLQTDTRRAMAQALLANAPTRRAWLAAGCWSLATVVLLAAGQAVRRAAQRHKPLVHDMTARCQLAERLEQLSRAVEQAADMVMIAGADGRITYVNPAFTRLTGHAREDAVGCVDFIQRSRLYGADELAHLRRALTVGAPCRGAVVLRRKDGGTFPAEQTVTPLLDESGRACNVVVVCKDMTTQTKLLASQVELQNAAAVQRQSFPRTTPPLPGLDLAGATLPATAMSGDFYDWVQRADGNLVVAIGDASGHGLGPALLAAEVHALLRCLLTMRLPLAEVPGRVHELLAADLPDGGFVTLLLVEIDPQSRRIRWVNAGHEPGVLLSRAREPTRLAATGPAIGVLASRTVHATRSGPCIGDEDLLVLTSDGVTEHALADGGRLGEAGLLTLLASVCRRSAAEIVAHLGACLRTSDGAATERDDATIVIVRGRRHPTVRRHAPAASVRGRVRAPPSASAPA